MWDVPTLYEREHVSKVGVSILNNDGRSEKYCTTTVILLYIDMRTSLGGLCSEGISGLLTSSLVFQVA